MGRRGRKNKGLETFSNWGIKCQKNRVDNKKWKQCASYTAHGEGGHRGHLDMSLPNSFITRFLTSGNVGPVLPSREKLEI